MNIFDYIEKYGNMSFREKEITEIDILIFSCLSYNDFSCSLENFNKKTTLKESIEILINHNNNVEGLSRNLGKNILISLKNKKRYQDIILKNYYYELGDDYQFGAITIDINNDLYVVYEGTDSTIQGWKEDFSFSYMYPTESQILSKEYLDSVIKYSSGKVIICGHSKGGNLAVVSALGINSLKRGKIQKIYSFDGPGLHNGIYGSEDYNKIKSKIQNIIPEESLFGLFLYQDKPKVIKSLDKGIIQHEPGNWIINDDEFVNGIQNASSIELKESIEKWIFSATLEERKEFIDTFFYVLQSSNIEKISDIPKDIKSSIVNIYKNTKDMSKETKDMLWSSFKLLLLELSKTKKENISCKVRTLINKNEKFMIQ